MKPLRTIRQKLNEPEAIAKRLAEARAKKAETTKSADKPEETK